MTADAWVTLVIVVVVVVVLVRDLLPPSAAMAGGMVALMATQVVTPEKALSGFANPAPATIAALFVLARAVERSGILRPVVSGLLGTSAGVRSALGRMSIPTAAASGLLNNTPIVAMLVPQIERWSDQRRISPSRFLMPLSFAAILGGTLTLIGTATNVVVSGQLEAIGLEPLGFFEISRAGIPIALLGLALVVTLAPIVLPARRSPRSDAEDRYREFTLEMTVETGGAIDGASVEDAKLRDLAGVFLVALERSGEQIVPVRPEYVLRGGDRLRFAGKANDVVDLQALGGLASAETEHLSALDTRRPGVYEAVIGGASPLVGRTLKEIGFRGRYQAAAIAIHRAGQRVDAKLGEVPLRVGDTLLLLSDSRFRDRWLDRNDFLLISGGSEIDRPDTRRRWIVAAVALAIVGVAASGALPLVVTALVGAMVIVATGILTPGQARDAVDLDVVVTVAAAFGLAAAVQSSGLADVFADGITRAFEWAGPRGVLLGIVLTTVVMTELITNNAAALLVFPIAIASAPSAAVDPRGIAIAVAIAASASFLTPIGYQTNTMVYGPGGYHFGDYARLGAPLTILVVVATVALIPMLWPS